MYEVSYLIYLVGGYRNQLYLYYDVSRNIKTNWL